MNVRDLILTNDQLTNTETETGATSTKRKRSKPSIEWEVVMADACDGAVRRKTAKTSRLLVLLMSQGQYYIKDEVVGTIEQVNAESLAKFLAGSPVMTVVPWCKGIGGGSHRAAEYFMRFVGNEDFQWLARRGLHSFSYDEGHYAYSSYGLRIKREQVDSPLQRVIAKIANDAIGHERWAELLGGADCESEVERKLKNLSNSQDIESMKNLSERFGIDWMREFVREFVNAPYVGEQLPAWWCIRQLLGEYRFDAASLREYLFYESVQQGYGSVNDYGGYTLRTFINEWKDTLDMQVALRGRVYDKYPKDLSGLHRRLSFRCELREIEVDEARFRMHSDRISVNELERGKYLIRVPRSKDDMLDEASQQANCLATYVKAYANGETDIYFMREVSKPEESLVTVEVRDGRVRQAYRACNRRPTDEEIQWLNEWADEIGIVGPDIDHQHPMVA